MKRGSIVAVSIVFGLSALLAGWLLVMTRGQAHILLSQPLGQHTVPSVTPAAYGLPYEDIQITSSDGTTLVGWYIPSRNRALVMAQHGYKNNRGEMLNEAAMLAKHGYGVLLTTVRAHDYSDGEQISFGVREMDDLDAWYRYAQGRKDVDATRIAVLGNSYGGTLVIQYAAQNPQIKAVVAQSAFASLEDTVGTGVSHFAGVPRFPFVPLIVFWAEQEAGFKASAIDARVWVHQLSPRPIFLMQGGADTIISPDSGAQLFSAAGEPKELWFEPTLGHAMFDGARPAEYETRVVGFLDHYLSP